MLPTTDRPATTTFEVTLLDGSLERIVGADAYQQESHLTTFFKAGSARQKVDSWATRVASVRTDRILLVRRVEA